MREIDPLHNKTQELVERHFSQALVCAIFQGKEKEIRRLKKGYVVDGFRLGKHFRVHQGVHGSSEQWY